MSTVDRRHTTQEFLETLYTRGLIGKVNSKLLHDVFTQNFPISAANAGRTFGAIIEQHDEGMMNPKMSNSDMTIFAGFFGINLMNSYLEYIKKLLKILLDKDKISYDDKTTYGKLINNICTKLILNKSENEIIRQNFFVDFRNAISHVDYYVTMNGVFFKIEQNMIRLDMDQFTSMVNEVKIIVDTLNMFVSEKTEELEKKAEEQEKKAEELNKQAVDITKINLERKQKTNAMKKETARLNRKATKLERKNEIINRKISRKKKTTARIISKFKN